MLQGVLNEYQRFNNWPSATCELPPIRDSLRATISVARSNFVNRDNFRDFAKSRHSVRNFTGEKVAYKEIKKAIEIAQTAPSVCNRQSAKVRVFYDDEMREVLKLQNGNRGFDQEIGALLIITSDTKSFFYSGEINQAFVDGGLFSMMLLMALHDLGYGACMLNWCVSGAIDRKLRDITKIGESEIVVMFMAVGVLPEFFKVALSQRRPISEVVSLEGGSSDEA